MSGAAAFITTVSNLPLVDLREEVRTLSNVAATPSVAMYPSQLNTYPNRAGGSVPALLMGGTVGGGAPYQLVGGTWVRRMTRTVANNGIQCTELDTPLTHAPAAFPNGPLPSGLFERRRYVWEWCMFGDALAPNNILAGGFCARTGGPQQLPANAFTDTSEYCFRRVDTENGGLWQVCWRRGLAVEARNFIPTTLSSLIPRTFKMEFIEGPGGTVGTLSMQIDGAEIVRFVAANFPAPVPGNVPRWALNIGSEGAAAATFDYISQPRFSLWPA